MELSWPAHRSDRLQEAAKERLANHDVILEFGRIHDFLSTAINENQVPNRRCNVLVPLSPSAGFNWAPWRGLHEDKNAGEWKIKHDLMTWQRILLNHDDDREREATALGGRRAILEEPSISHLVARNESFFTSTRASGNILIWKGVIRKPTIRKKKVDDRIS